MAVDVPRAQLPRICLRLLLLLLPLGLALAATVSPPCTVGDIAAALAAASSGDEILLSSCAASTVLQLTAPFVLRTSLTLDGGPNAPTLNGQGTAQLLVVGQGDATGTKCSYLSTYEKCAK